MPAASYTTGDIRNVLLCGHGGSGKTSLIDALLYESKTVGHKGSPVTGNSNSDFEKEAPASLRLERHDRRLVASVRQGENDWTPIGHFQEDLPRQIYVGVAAVNATQAPFVAEFEDFTISPRP